MKTGLSPNRRIEWETERRILMRERQRMQGRIDELTNILNTFFPEKSA